MRPIVLSGVAGRALARNRMRTILAALGIIIGVAAVICTVAIGEGASVQIDRAISAIGVNFVWIEAGSANVAGVRTGAYGRRTLLVSDALAIRSSVPLVMLVSPQVDTGVQLVRGNQNWRTVVRGESADYFKIRSWEPINGGRPSRCRVGLRPHSDLARTAKRAFSMVRLRRLAAPGPRWTASG